MSFAQQTSLGLGLEKNKSYVLLFVNLITTYVKALDFYCSQESHSFTAADLLLVSLELNLLMYFLPDVKIMSGLM